MRPPSITFRLTLFFSTVSAAVLLAAGYLVGASMDAHLEEQDRLVLDGKLKMVRHALAAAHTSADLDEIPQLLDDALVGHPGLSIAVFGPDRRLLFASSDALFPGGALEGRARAAPSGAPQTTVWEKDGHRFRELVAAVPTGLAAMPPSTVAIAVNIDHERDFMAAFRQKLSFAILSGVVLMGLLGWVAARRGLTPVRHMARVARRISASRLDERLTVAAVPPELEELATAFNDMLARLEQSFRRLSDFSSDLAHELRTPITNLRMETEVVLSRVRTAESYREVLYSNLEEYERLARMIADMLFLAKADHGLIVPQRETVDLASEVRELFAFYEALAEERGVRLLLAGAGSVEGDRLMIRRALGNLLANAIQYTARGSEVGVRIETLPDGQTRLCVENPGKDIAPEHLPRLFDRFYRADPSRHKASEGAGLGLAIVKSIMDAHRATIGASSTGGTTRFEIRFPRSGPLSREAAGIATTRG